MPVKKTIPYKYGTFFITFSCHQWLPLIDKVKGYDVIYKWFDHLKEKGHYINGYAIMPNHVHVLISFTQILQSINTIIGNGKRFIAYEIIKRLQQNEENELLQYLNNKVSINRKENKKLHEVWELSFDWKECRSKNFITQKLKYMHDNPCIKKWNLCNSPAEYLHSSAKFYIEEKQGIYPITNFMEIEDIDFLKGNFVS